ncbi:MAG: alpha/beta fold hydrolase [Erysipelotrichaceae bacterium]|nr:alpha/beta fold hydrolase [Erysipelotrichaceae bacterium]
MKEFYINDDGIRLHAKLDMPADRSGKCPLVIVIHGFTGHMEERHIVALHETLNENGYASLRVDMYGHGKSEGEFKNHNIFKWINNALCVVDYAKKLDFVSDLYLCGHSQGGFLTTIIAGMRPDDFKAIMPLSPALMIPDSARKGEVLGVKIDPDHYPDEIDLYHLKLSGDYFRTARLLHPEESMHLYHKPVLIVYGEKDPAVPIRYVVDAQKEYDDCKLVIIPDDDHGYSLHLDEMLKAVTDFLKDN